MWRISSVQGSFKERQHSQPGPFAKPAAIAKTALNPANARYSLAPRRRRALPPYDFAVVDPERALMIGPRNGRKARESGLRLKA